MYDSMVIYRSFYDALKELDDTTAAAVFRAICEYGLNGQEIQLQGIEKAIFALIRPQIDANNKRKENGKRGAEFGKLGGRPKKEENPKETPRKPQENPKETPNVNANVNVNVEKKSSAKALLKEIADAWNSYSKRGNIPKVVSIPSGSMREKLLHARLESFGKDQVLAAVDNVFSSSFLRGENDKGWACSFDWFLKPNNFVKILDGNYNDKEAPQRKDSAGALSAFYEDAVKWAQGG